MRYNTNQRILYECYEYANVKSAETRGSALFEREKLLSIEIDTSMTYHATSVCRRQGGDNGSSFDCYPKFLFHPRTDHDRRGEQRSLSLSSSSEIIMLCLQKFLPIGV
jgi:hypothetical protein